MPITQTLSKVRLLLPGSLCIDVGLIKCFRYALCDMAVVHSEESDRFAAQTLSDRQPGIFRHPLPRGRSCRTRRGNFTGCNGLSSAILSFSPAIICCCPHATARTGRFDMVVNCGWTSSQASSQSTTRPARGACDTACNLERMRLRQCGSSSRRPCTAYEDLLNLPQAMIAYPLMFEINTAPNR